MPLVDQIMEGAALLARQATSSALTGVTSVAAGAPSLSSATSSTSVGGSAAPSITPVPEPSGTGAAPSATTSSSSGSGSSGSSPLLFFVALGFGVVFTNLWIIVGVKYCFRYNARARQLRLAAEDGENINMDNMPHPRRRRREKKLMTIDEVNEKFPMVKYKTWVASRAREGLPTRGGVDAPTSRPSSVVEAEGTIPPVSETLLAAESKDTADSKAPAVSTSGVAGTAALTPATDGSTPASSESPASHLQSEVEGNPRVSTVSADAGDSPDPKDALNRTTTEEHEAHSDDDEDEHIDSALPPECVGTSGDTCAICIDTLEDDDDVRGLTCGHAFHAVCLDPWLTSRRACCPLCKADYYTPKPRAPPQVEGVDAAGNPQAAGGASAAPLGNDLGRNPINMPSRPGSSWRNMRPPVRIFATRFVMGPQSYVGGAASNAQAQTQAGARPQPQRRFIPRSQWISGLRPFRRQGQAEPSQQASQQANQPAAGSVAAAEAPAEVTPSQLEAGVRN